MGSTGFRDGVVDLLLGAALGRIEEGAPGWVCCGGGGCNNGGGKGVEEEREDDDDMADAAGARDREVVVLLVVVVVEALVGHGSFTESSVRRDPSVKLWERARKADRKWRLNPLVGDPPPHRFILVNGGGLASFRPAGGGTSTWVEEGLWSLEGGKRRRGQGGGNAELGIGLSTCY